MIIFLILILVLGAAGTVALYIDGHTGDAAVAMACTLVLFAIIAVFVSKLEESYIPPKSETWQNLLNAQKEYLESK